MFELFRAMLKLGASMPWQDAMEALTGQRNILAEPLLNYFKPLQDWLEETNRKEGNYVGWIPKSAEDTIHQEENKIEKVEEEEPKKETVRDVINSLDKETINQMIPILQQSLEALKKFRLRF